jgi:hypothetical protein
MMKITMNLLLLLLSSVAAFRPALMPRSSALQLRVSPAILGGENTADSPWELPEDFSKVVRVEGGTLRTWDFPDNTRSAITCVLETDGRPLTADIQLWIGPDWTPYSMKVYSEDGSLRPIRTLIGTRNRSNTVAIRNTHSMEFPMNAVCSYAPSVVADLPKEIPKQLGKPVRVQGGAVYTTPFPPEVEQVQVLMNTDGRQLNARVELLNGPNNIKQTLEVFTNNGQANPLYIVMNAPGSRNVVRIVNIAPVEFPCEAWISEA